MLTESIAWKWFRFEQKNDGENKPQFEAHLCVLLASGERRYARRWEILFYADRSNRRFTRAIVRELISALSPSVKKGLLFLKRAYHRKKRVDMAVFYRRWPLIPIDNGRKMNIFVQLFVIFATPHVPAL